MISAGLHVDQLLYRVPGGIGTYVHELVPALTRVDADLRLTLFHGRFPGRSLPRGWADGHRVVAIDAGIRLLYPGWAVAGRPSLPEALRGVDVLHAPSPAAVPPPAPGQRLVVTVHDLAFLVAPATFPPAWRAMFRLGLRRAVRRADALVAVSEHTARDLVDRAGADPDRVRVTPLAAALPAAAGDPGAVLDRLGIPRPYVLFVGTLEPRKNLVRLLRAYRRAVARCHLPHALVLAGPAGWGSRALEHELSIPAAGTVIRTGHVAAEELDALYRGAAAFAYPSLYEGFGLPVLEAMARGIPAVVSTAASLPEVAGDAAVTVPPRSVEALARALERLLSDRDVAGRLGEAGRARAEAFSWERTARETVAVYREVLAR